MERNKQTNSLNMMGLTLPDPSILAETQKAAAENSARMANVACHYAISLNRAWFDLWNTRLTQYMELPKRMASAQSDFVEQALDDYQESMQQLGGIATKVSEEAGAAIESAASRGEEVARDYRQNMEDNIRETERRAGEGVRRAEESGRNAFEQVRTNIADIADIADQNLPKEKSSATAASGQNREPKSEQERMKDKRSPNTGKDQPRINEPRRSSH